MWNVGQYEKYRGERSRPFLDLLRWIPEMPVARAVDLGCGTAELTQLLGQRWPEALVLAVDSSQEMLASAAERAVPGNLELVHADVQSFLARTQAPFDLIVSNATLHWVPDHESLFPALAAALAPRGVLAVQMPANAGAPTHVLLAETLAEDPRWRALGALRADPVKALPWYVDKLWSVGLTVDSWETIYLHVLPGDDPVLEWMKGTALRPVLAKIPEGERAEFLATFGAKLRVAYPPSGRGTVLPFRRIFLVARRPA